jgi:signal transduction histidine kinase
MRTRLLLVLTGVVALVLAVHDIPLAQHLRRVERDRLVTGLERDAFILAGRVEEALEDGTAADEPALELLVTRYARDEDIRVVIVDDTATGVIASDEAGFDEDFSNRIEIERALALGDPQTGQRPSQTLGEDLFFVAVPVLSGDDVVGAVRLSAPERVVSDRVAGRVRGLIAVALISLMIAVAVAWLLAASVIRPLTRLRMATERLASGDLSTRADDSDGPSEVKSLAGSFNSMAGRLEQLVERQRAFAGTASHQLRTPLTALRLRLEQLGAEIDESSEAGHHVDAALAETDRLHRMIEGLLALSRAEDAAVGADEVDVGATVADRIAYWEPLAEERDVILDGRSAAGMFGEAVPGALEQIVDNLVDNALEVSPPGSRIVVSVGRDGPWVELHVIDEGPGLTDEERAMAFDRFWRGESATPGGSGLGLAIVHQLVAAGGGTVELRRADTGGIDAVVRLRGL